MAIDFDFHEAAVNSPFTKEDSDLARELLKKIVARSPNNIEAFHDSGSTISIETIVAIEAMLEFVILDREKRKAETELNRVAIARALAERFIARGNARVTGSPYKSFDDMPYSYTEDFLIDADAVLGIFSPPARVRETINDLFNDTLLENGAQGYGRDTPAEKAFTEVVGKLQRDVINALNAPPVDHNLPIPEGMTRWYGGKRAPADWDHGRVAYNGYEGEIGTVSSIHSTAWRADSGHRVIAYKAKAE